MERARSLADDFKYSIQFWNSPDELIDRPGEARLVLAAMNDEDSRKKIAEYSRTIRQVFPEAYVVCGVSGTLGKELAAYTKKSGADLILLEEELFESSKLDYVCAEIVRNSFLRIMQSDLSAGVPLDFDVHHLFPQRRKFLKFLFKDDVLSPSKLDKLREASEIYIARDSAEAFSEYVKRNQDRSAGGLARRCRAEYLALYAGYATLALLLTDRSAHNSCSQGQALAEKCLRLSKDLVGTLASHGSPFDIVNNSAIGCFGSVERAPAVAAYAGLLALRLGLSEVDRIMMAALLSLVGMLPLSPAVTKKIRENRLEELTYAERAQYRLFPLRSLDLMLSRKLPMDELLRQLMLRIHERSDGKGFPRAVSGSKIPEGSQLIQFCTDLDNRTLIRMATAQADPGSAIHSLIAECKGDPGRFSPEFTAKIAQHFGEITPT